MIDPAVRRAALIATGITLPVVVVMALGISALAGGDPDPGPSADPTSALSFAAPPRADVDAASCAKVLAQLPVNLGTLPPRIVRTKPDTPFVVAWGEPAVVLRCGVARPKSLKAGSDIQAFSVRGAAGPFYDVTDDGADKVFTTVDRAAYISLTVPRTYSAGPVGPLSAAIAKALPAVCSTDSATPDLTKLCTRRK